MEKTEVRRIIAEKGVRYLDMVSLMDRECADIIEADENGILLRFTDTSSIKKYYITAENMEFVNRAKASINEADEIVAHEKFYVDMLFAEFGMSETLPFITATYTGVGPPQLPESAPEIKLLNEDYIELLTREYEHGNIEYITERVASKSMFGAFVDGQLAGFIGSHDDGPIGLLKVLPDYRRRGIAEALEKYMIADFMKRGILIYAHIYAENEASLSLQRRVGMTIADEPVYCMVKE